MLASKIAQGELPGVGEIGNVISVQETVREGEVVETSISAHAGTKVGHVTTTATATPTDSFQDGSIKPTEDGYDIRFVAKSAPGGLGADEVLFNGPIQALKFEDVREEPLNLFVNEQLVQSSQPVRVGRNILGSLEPITIGGVPRSDAIAVGALVAGSGIAVAALRRR